MTPGRSGEEYISGIESVTAREMILRTSLGGVVRRILEYFSWSDFDIFLEGLVKLATRGYLPICQTLFHESMGPTSVSGMLNVGSGDKKDLLNCRARKRAVSKC